MFLVAQPSIQAYDQPCAERVSLLVLVTLKALKVSDASSTLHLHVRRGHIPGGSLTTDTTTKLPAQLWL